MEVWGGNEATETALTTAGLDAWVFSRPYGTDPRGGDLYSLSSCSSGRITRLLVADVSGHGSRVAPLATRLRQLLHRYINHIDSSRLVQAISEDFKKVSDCRTYATGVLSTFFAPTHELTVCNAGHPPPLVFRCRESDWFPLDHRGDPTSRHGQPSNLPIGMFDGGHYDRVRAKLEVGDLVLFYTDGLTDTLSEDGELLGPEGLLGLIRGLELEGLDELLPNLLAAIRRWAGGELPDDDVTMVLLRHNAQGTRLVDDLKAPFRYLWHGITNRKINRRPALEAPGDV